MKTFKDLEFTPHTTWWVLAHMFFDNWYWVSVIKTKGSYWYEKWLYELAVLKGTKKHRDLCYTTEITDDVLWHLTEKQVTKYMKDVQLLD